MNLRNCIICRREFIPHLPTQFTCCEECRKLYVRARQREYYRTHYGKKRPAKLFTKKCPVCGKEFVTDRKDKKYCCERCCRIYYNNIDREARKESAKLTQLGKNNVVRWIRLRLTNGTVATNKKPYSPSLCAQILRVPVEEVYLALAEYDFLVSEGREEEFYKGV